MKPIPTVSQRIFSDVTAAMILERHCGYQLQSKGILTPPTLMKKSTLLELRSSFNLLEKRPIVNTKKLKSSLISNSCR